MAKLDIEHPRNCPFKKRKHIMYEIIGPKYTSVPIVEEEEFQICEGEDCMMYLYDAYSNTEQCLLGRKPYEL